MGDFSTCSQTSLTVAKPWECFPRINIPPSHKSRKSVKLQNNKEFHFTAHFHLPVRHGGNHGVTSTSVPPNPVKTCLNLESLFLYFHISTSPHSRHLIAHVSFVPPPPARRFRGRGGACIVRAGTDTAGGRQELGWRAAIVRPRSGGRERGRGEGAGGRRTARNWTGRSGTQTDGRSCLWWNYHHHPHCVAPSR